VAHDVDGWSHFLHLYTQVIQDIPLVVKPSSPDAAQNISEIVVHFEAARETQKFEDREDFVYRVVWEIFDKDGESGTISIYNSFDIAVRSCCLIPFRRKAKSGKWQEFGKVRFRSIFHFLVQPEPPEKET
jgi:hypothetical protein